MRRDVDRLSELGYPVHAARGPDGGYRLDPGSELPPLLFYDDQAIALAVALQVAAASGAAIAEGAERARATVRQVLPARLRHRVDAIEVTALDRGAGANRADVEPAVLVSLSDAVRARELLRFDYGRPPGKAPDDASTPAPSRRVEPHHVVTRAGRWYLLAWDLDREDWRTFRADRIHPRTPTGPRFIRREIPGGDVAARFKGFHAADRWPCRGEVIVSLPASEVAPYLADDASAEALGDDRCRLSMGSWSWAGLAASIGRLDADIEVLGPPQLRAAFAALAYRYAAAGTS